MVFVTAAKLTITLTCVPFYCHTPLRFHVRRFPSANRPSSLSFCLFLELPGEPTLSVVSSLCSEPTFRLLKKLNNLTDCCHPKPETAVRINVMKTLRWNSLHTHLKSHPELLFYMIDIYFTKGLSVERI